MTYSCSHFHKLLDQTIKVNSFDDFNKSMLSLGPYHKKDIDMLECMQRRATKMIPELRDLSYEEGLKECDLTTLETRRFRGDQIEVFKILNGFENIDRNIFFSLKKEAELEDMK